MFQVALVGRRSGRQLALSNPSSCLSTYTAPPPPPPLSLKPNELSFGMDKLEFEFRRLKLVSRLPPHSTVILAGYGLRYISNAGIFYPFHQSTDFAYLTGFNEPDAALVLERDEGLARRYRFTMFCKPVNNREDEIASIYPKHAVNIE